MTLSVLLSNAAIVDRVGCVECEARAGDPCWSRRDGERWRPMTNEVHRTRRADAGKVRPERGRK